VKKEHRAALGYNIDVRSSAPKEANEGWTLTLPALGVYLDHWGSQASRGNKACIDHCESTIPQGKL
jgi:hypothetical protein